MIVIWYVSCELPPSLPPPNPTCAHTLTHTHIHMHTHTHWHRLWGQKLEPQNEAEKNEEKSGFQNNGFNQFRSDRIPLDREIPDTRDPRFVGGACGWSSRFVGGAPK